MSDTVVPKVQNRTKHSPELNRARAKIRASKSVHLGLARYKSHADLDELRRVLPALLDHPAYRSLFWPTPTPRSYNFLGGGGVPAQSSFQRELLWCVQTLLPHSNKIQEFIILKHDFEEAFLRGDADKTSNLLEVIESQFGVSLWLAEATINCLQTFKSYSAQQQFADSIAVIQGAHPLIRYLISWMSSRAGQNIASPDFYNLLDDMVPMENGFATLTHVVLGDCRIDNAASAAGALTFTDMFPIIDRYLLAVEILQAYAASLTLGHPDIAILRQELPPLVQKISDPSLHRLAIAFGIIETSKLDAPLLAMFDHYTCGQYPLAIREAQASLDNKCSIEALFVLLKAANRLNIEASPFSDEPNFSPIRKIADDLAKIINFSDESSGARTRLSKIILSNASTAWAASLSLILERYQRDERSFGFHPRQIFFAFRAEHENPTLAIAFENFDSSSIYLALLGSASTTVLLSAAIVTNTGWNDPAMLSIPQSRITKSRALATLRVGEPRDAIKLIEPLYAASNGHIRSELGQTFVESLLRCGELLKCSEVCVELFHTSQSFATSLPLDRILDEIVTATNSRSIDIAFHGRLSIVLIFDIYSRFISSKRDPERADAFKDFLIANGIRYASELANIPDQFPREQLVQFLKFVCIPEVLDQSLALDSTRAVEDERSRILVLLSELTAAEGKPPPSELLEELSTIKTKQVVRDTTLRLDQSKVYVNIDGITKAVSGQMREMWSRYKLLTSQQRATNLNDLQKILEAALGERVALLSLTLPPTEANKLFARILGELLEMFALSKEFGLDANLSTNIRHGFVMREIRGPLLLHHLVTNKISADGSYQENAHWTKRLTDCSPDELGQISNALAKFSENVDSQIEYLNRNLIRIRSEQAPDGLFNFTVDHVTLQLLQRRCDKAETYDEFLDFIIEFLWSITNRALESLREVLFSVTLTNLLVAVEDLQDALRNFSDSEEISALTSAANLARPDLRSAVERVASWFTLSGNTEYQDYDLRISYEAGLATVKSYYSHLNIVSEFESETLIMAGRTLPFFARLFSILLDNSAFHSGLNSGTLLLQTKARCEGGLLHLSARNNLATTVDLDHVRRQVAIVNSDFGRERASKFIREEGGSGYPKIWKILAHDLGGEHALDVSLTSTGEFLVEIMIEAKGIVL